MYGLNSSGVLITAIMWCRSFSILMTGDRLFCLTGRLSPKLTALLMTALRFIPELIQQGRKINAYSRLNGKYGEAAIEQLRRRMSVFSALITWSIENGIQTADSMKARGFELHGRTSYNVYRFMAEDFAVLLLSVLSFVVSLWVNGRVSVEFYPKIEFPLQYSELSAASAVTLTACLFPVLFTLYIDSRRKRFSKGGCADEAA